MLSASEVSFSRWGATQIYLPLPLRPCDVDNKQILLYPANALCLIPIYYSYIAVTVSKCLKGCSKYVYNRFPQCIETGHFEVQNGEKNSGKWAQPTVGYPSPHPTPIRPLGSWPPATPPPTISGSATAATRPILPGLKSAIGQKQHLVLDCTSYIHFKNCEVKLLHISRTYDGVISVYNRKHVRRSVNMELASFLPSEPFIVFVFLPASFKTFLFSSY